jgi:IclR family pca regulon transcriptional regulator
MKKVTPHYFSEPFAKGLKILNLFSPDQKILSLKEIAETIKANESSVYRYTNTLEKLGFLKKDPKTKMLSLDQKAYFMGQRLVKSFSLLEIVRPIIDEVYETYTITIDSCLIEDYALLQLYFRAVDSSYNAVVSYYRLITNDVIHCSGLGKAIMAYLPEDEMLSIVERVHSIKRTEKSITDKDALLEDLRKTKERGYAINDEEYVIGGITIATPFFSPDRGRPVGAVSFDFSTAQYSAEQVESKYASILLNLGNKISKAIQ